MSSPVAPSPPNSPEVWTATDNAQVRWALQRAWIFASGKSLSRDAVDYLVAHMSNNRVASVLEAIERCATECPWGMTYADIRQRLNTPRLVKPS